MEAVEPSRLLNCQGIGDCGSCRAAEAVGGVDLGRVLGVSGPRCALKYGF